uniref:Uncharacterized protein n=1 Tax=Meloidogyne enterolobii TaxID=390850 RepID=A0A6V7URW6_MELEN|nr:unnamed protein product [Meloidogyne enterolobii]
MARMMNNTNNYFENYAAEMEKINNSTSLLPKIKTTITNPTHFLVDQDDLDKLSNQLKLLKIDDFTINKILKKFRPIKKEVKSEPQECHQVLEPQQQPFVGYDGLFEFAISQVIDCGYGHVLPSNICRTNKNSTSINTIKLKTKTCIKTRINNNNSNNNNMSDKIMLQKLKLLNKVYSKKGLEMVSQEEREQLIKIYWGISGKVFENCV